MRLKPLPKFILIFATVGASFYGLKYAMDHGYISAPVNHGASVIPKANLPTVAPLSKPPSESGVIPKTTISATPPAASAGSTGAIRLETIPWNATMGLHAANGGKQTAPGSIMARHGIKLSVSRVDDYSQMQNDLVAFAQALAKGEPNPKVGTHYVVIMGNGAPNFLGGLNQQLARLGPDYIAEIIDGIGYSRGEDKCMGTPEMAANPQKLRGATIAGVKLDGDQDVCLAHAANNDIPFNADETTYDYDKLNWLSTPSFTDADQKYITGYCEPRAEVHDGKRTGKTVQVCVNGVATWTPGDVAVAKEKGGLVTLASTGDQQYIWQMPATVIGIKKWSAGNRTQVEALLAAIHEGGDAVQNDPAALTAAAKASAEVYGEEDAAYWEKYYRGVVESDKLGRSISLGGSYANKLADALHLFGLLPGADNLMELVYNSRGEVGQALYPDIMPNFPPAKEVINPSYLAAIQAHSQVAESPAVPTYAAGSQIATVAATKSWHVNFQTGKATFTKDALAELEGIRKGTEIGGFLIEVHGHTDNVGNPATNKALSQKRAQAVKEWLMQQSPVNYPANRIRVVAYGSAEPLAPNDSDAGRAMNRRVDIVLGTN